MMGICPSASGTSASCPEIAEDGWTQNKPAKVYNWECGCTVSGLLLGTCLVPQIDKTAAIAACSSPKTIKEVRQLLGLVGFYRRFIPNYSELTSPLTDLTKKRSTRSGPVEGAVPKGPYQGKDCYMRWAILTLS